MPTVDQTLLGLLVGIYFIPIHAAAQSDPITLERPTRWVAIGETSKSYVSYDRSSILRQEDGTYRVWVRMEYKEAQTRTDDGKPVVYDRILDQFDIDCRLRRSRYIAEHMYYADRHQWESPEGTPPLNWHSWVPDTLEEHVGISICKNGAYLPSEVSNRP